MRQRRTRKRIILTFGVILLVAGGAALLLRYVGLNDRESYQRDGWDTDVITASVNDVLSELENFVELRDETPVEDVLSNHSEIMPREADISAEDLAKAVEGIRAARAQEYILSQIPCDTVPPVIEGAEDITIHAGESVSYKKNIVLSDDSGEEPSLEIDVENVNSNVAGDYPVRYIARDSAGNETVCEIILHVLEPEAVTEEMVNELADGVIATVVTDEMTKYDQAYALWRWCRGNMSFTDEGGDINVLTGAYAGLKERRGDCWVYCATYSFLLTRCGIDNMCVERVGGTTEHWWNLVNTGDGWYHCDAGPRNIHYPYLCFMQTDAQVQAYTEWNQNKPNYFTFDSSLYPERATEIIFDGGM